MINNNNIFYKYSLRPRMYGGTPPVLYKHHLIYPLQQPHEEAIVIPMGQGNIQASGQCSQASPPGDTASLWEH